MSAKAYRAAGVDLEAADSIKENIIAFASLTHGPDVLKNGNSFAGLYRLSGYKKPVLISSTDGVGTKLKIASLLGHYESIGVDLVNLNVNDIITSGVKPLFFLDYISVGSLDPQVIEPLLRGMAWACRDSGTALIGGETSQAPGMYTGQNFDLAGTIVGVVEEADIIDNNSVVNGAVLIGIPSNGLHTNGYSLARKLMFETLSLKVTDLLPGHTSTVGEVLLAPHKNYSVIINDLVEKKQNIAGVAHITGGGLIDNVPRILPNGLSVEIDIGRWKKIPIFDFLNKALDLKNEEFYRTFNMGIGLVFIVGANNKENIMELLKNDGCVEIGRVIKDASQKVYLNEQ